MKTRFEKRHIMSEKDMAIMFEGFNEEFFKGRLCPTIKVRFVTEKHLRKANPREPADAAWRPGINEIWIDKVYARSESISCIILLHEMAHAALEATYVGHPGPHRGHGMIFQVELYRLIQAGAYDGLL